MAQTHALPSSNGATPRMHLRYPGAAVEIDESYRTLLRGLLLPASGAAGAPRTIGLTSSRPGEGVSTVAWHLAKAAAVCSERQVLLVDANLSRPSLDRAANVSLSPGLANVLLDHTPVTEVIQRACNGMFSVISAGKAGENAAWVYDLEGLPAVVEAMATGFDLVIFDLPAIGHRSDALPLVTLLDGVVLVVEEAGVPWETAQRTAQLLRSVGVKLLGAALNKRH